VPDDVELTGRPADQHWLPGSAPARAWSGLAAGFAQPMDDGKKALRPKPRSAHLHLFPRRSDQETQLIANAAAKPIVVVTPTSRPPYS
jgi:hypothetical protein